MEQKANENSEIIENFLSRFRRIGGHGFYKLLERALEGDWGMVRRAIEGKEVIELGPGDKPSARRLLNLGATRYTGVDLAYRKGKNGYPTIMPQALDVSRDKRVSWIDTDGLSHLLTQEDESAIVVSSGVFCTGFTAANERDLENTTAHNYFARLIKEVHRITPKGLITAHVHNDSFFPEFPEMMANSGFEQIEKHIWKKNSQPTQHTKA